MTNPYEERARTAKAVRLESKLSDAGLTSVDVEEADPEQRRDWAREAGESPGTSAATWEQVAQLMRSSEHLRDTLRNMEGGAPP